LEEEGASLQRVVLSEEVLEADLCGAQVMMTAERAPKRIETMHQRTFEEFAEKARMSRGGQTVPVRGG